MVFSLRIVNADFYTAEPLSGLDPVYSGFRASKIAKVPVIRIFGSTPNGQKCCLHIHGVFPYICVPYGGDEPRDAYLKQFATSVDFALHVSQGKASSSTRHVHHIEIISARSYYGYHDEEQEFMKVYFYNPFVITRVVDLLQNGAVMNKTFQPYESHIPYIQQMFIDYNLYGMNLLNASSAMFRTPIQLKQDDPAVYEDSSHSPVTPVLSPSSTNTGTPSDQLWTEETVPRHYRHSQEVERFSVCEIEVDIKAENVMNQFEIGTSIGNNPGLLAIWEDERQRRQDENDTSDLGPPVSQDRGNIPLLEAEQRYKERLEQIIADRNIMMQSQAEDHEHSLSSPPSIEREPSSFEINENTPIIDHSIVEEVIRSSQRTFSQETGNATDIENVEILASLAESQSQSRRQDLTADISGDEEDEDGRQEDEDSIVMSQQVWDDTDPAAMIDNADVSGESNEKESTDAPGSQLRMSQFDFQGLDDTWEVSLLSEEPIVQLDGVNDDTTDTPPPVRPSKRKPLFQKSAYPTRHASTQKIVDVSSSDGIMSSVTAAMDREKRSTTRRLGMSSVRVTTRSQITDSVKKPCKPLNNQVELGEINDQGQKVVRTKPSDSIAKDKFPKTSQSKGTSPQFIDPLELGKIQDQEQTAVRSKPSNPIAKDKDTFPKATRSKNTSPQFTLHLSESSSSAEENAPSLKPGTNLSEDNLEDSKTSAPAITHITDLEIPHVRVNKAKDASLRRMSLSLRGKHRRSSSLRNNTRGDSSLVHVSDEVPLTRVEHTDEEPKASSFEHIKRRNVTQKSDPKLKRENPPIKNVKRLKINPEDKVKAQKQGEQHQIQQNVQWEYRNDDRLQQHKQQQHQQQQQQLRREQKRQQQQTKPKPKVENSYTDIKRRVFSEYKFSGLKKESKTTTAQLFGKEEIETTDVVSKTPLKALKMQRRKQQRSCPASATSKANVGILKTSEIVRADTLPEKDLRQIKLVSLEGNSDDRLRLEYKQTKTNSLSKLENKVNETKLHDAVAFNDKLDTHAEKQDSNRRNRNSHQNARTKTTPQMKSLKICLTDVASIDSKRYLYNAALERWKRQNKEQQKLRHFISKRESIIKSSQKSPLKSNMKFSPRRKASKTSPRTSPQGKRYGILDVTIHASPRPKSSCEDNHTPMSSITSSSPFNTVRSSTTTTNRSPPYTLTVPSSPKLSNKLSSRYQATLSPEKGHFKSTTSPNSKRHGSHFLASVCKTHKTKRNILSQIDKPSHPRQRQDNEIDRLFDTLGSCLSKEVEECFQVKHKESTIQNELSELRRVNEEKKVNNNQDYAGLDSAHQTSTKEDGILQKSPKRKISDSSTPSRKQPKLSLKLKSKYSNLQKGPNDLENESNKSSLQDSTKGSVFDEASPVPTDVSSDSPSILDETILGKSMSMNDLSTPWKHQSSVDNNIKSSVCAGVTEMDIQCNDFTEETISSDDTYDPAEVITSKDQDWKEHADESKGRRKSGEEVEEQDSDTYDPTEMLKSKDQDCTEYAGESKGRRNFSEEVESQVLISSPDLFDSVLYSMSYLSPERRDEERASPPLPCTPTKTTNTESKEENPQGAVTSQLQGAHELKINSESKTANTERKDENPQDVLTTQLQVACELKGNSEKYPFRTFSPAFHSNPPTNEFSEELNDSSLNSSKLMVGVSQAQEKPASSLQTTLSQDVKNQKGSSSSAATVNRTCTTVSENKSITKTSALNVLRRYCRQLEKEKLALQGLEVERSQDSVPSSSSVETPAVINHSTHSQSQSDLCSTRHSDISPSCSTGSACQKELESTSPFCVNVFSKEGNGGSANITDSAQSDTFFFSPKEPDSIVNSKVDLSPADISTMDRQACSPVDKSEVMSPVPISTDQSIEVDLHITDSPLIETPEQNAPTEKENVSHNLVDSLSQSDDGNSEGIGQQSPMISCNSNHSIRSENSDNDDLDPGERHHSDADKIDDGSDHSSSEHDIQHKDFAEKSTFFPHVHDSVINEPYTVIMPRREAPTAAALMQSLKDFGIPRCRYQEPFYSDPNDVPDSTMDVGGRLLKVQSNQVKTLQKFDTKSPFAGIQELREMFCSNHETSFLHACQDNIGTAETFMMGIENNPELKVAFMGDKDLTITPCSIPPNPAVVRSWIQTKLTKRLQHTKDDDKITKPDKDKHKTSPICKDKVVEPTEKRQTNLSNTEPFCDKSKMDHSSGSGKTSQAQSIPLDLDRKSPKSPNSFEKKDPVPPIGGSSVNSFVKEDPVPRNSGSPEFPSNDSARAAKPDHNTGSPTKQDEITSPNTLFSPVDKTFVLQSKKDMHDTDDIDKQSPNETTSAELKTTDVQQKSKQDTQQVFNFAFQSTPLPSRIKPKSGITSPSNATPTPIAGLPRFPFLTPISASTQVPSTEKQTLKSPPGDDVEKVQNSDVAPKRQLILSQLKLLTPEVVLRRNLSEAGSEIEGPSPINTAGYKVPQLNVQDAKASHEVQHLTLLSIELHVRTRKDKRPDPEFDPICALFYHIQTDSPCPTNKVTGIICVDKDSVEIVKSKETSKGSTILGTSGSSIRDVSQAAKRPILERSGVTQYRVHYVEEEKDIFHAFLFLVRKWDPDILIGYELQMLSWGYLIQRALVFDLDLGKLLSRVTGSSSDCNVDAEKDPFGAAYTHELKIGGRVILNVWRLMRHEVALNVYSFENVAFHVLHERIPLFTFRSLSDWWDHKTDLHRWRTVEHYVSRCHGNIRLLEQVDFIGRTSELARLFGILFYSVVSRGSQFRVESTMLRISKPLKYLAISPSVQQRNSMNAPEVIPLVLEPESRFYTNPVLVLDFQSLYPSMIIAYNYCYSTCLGRVSCLEELGEFKFGASTLAVPPLLIKKLKDDIHISPNGVAFVKSNIRLGVLPKMLEDILNTRIMVKNSMKKWKNKKSVHRMLDARQLGLKLIANVTYGYTAAHFSGRMPCVEIGDSIVRKARETLEHAIHVVNTTSKWGARVVYGDTDSMFVLLDGVSKDEAFNIGRDIAATITAMNPKPVKLKFEKVYLPCVLQTKKRYVGYMYETPDQKEPVFDAKGIETVRRDSCPAVAKVLEKSLRLLFETKDVSLVKRYVQRQFSKVMEGRVSLQDLTFAKEYRGMASYKPGACVPALELTRQMLKEDRRSEPRVGERVPYVIVYGSPGLPLIKLVRRPLEVLQDPSLRINALYYITKQLIPPLNRAFSLIGVDVSAWFAEVPRTSRVKVQPFTSSDARKKTISHYFTTTNCPVCQQTTTSRLCDACTNNPQKVAVTLNAQIRQHERRHRHLAEICYQCCGSRDTKLCCVSLDCPVFHKLVKTSRDLEPSNHLRQLISSIIE